MTHAITLVMYPTLPFQNMPSHPGRSTTWVCEHGVCVVCCACVRAFVCMHFSVHCALMGACLILAKFRPSTTQPMAMWNA